MDNKQAIEVLKRMKEINEQLKNYDVVQALDLAIESLHYDNATVVSNITHAREELREIETQFTETMNTINYALSKLGVREWVNTL